MVGSLPIDGARAALDLDFTKLGYYPVRVLPSKTAILPVNPKFLPRVSSCLDFNMITDIVLCFTNMMRKCRHCF